VRSKFSCARSSHDLCVRAHAHSLEQRFPTFFVKLKIPFLNGQGLKVYLLILNPSLLFHCFLGCLPRKPVRTPLIWYIYHLSRCHRSGDMTDWPVSVKAFWSKFSDPYFGPGLTEKSKIWRESFFMVSNNGTKNHSNWWWSCQIVIKNWLISHGITPTFYFLLPQGRLKNSSSDIKFFPQPLISITITMCLASYINLSAITVELRLEEYGSELRCD